MTSFSSDGTRKRPREESVEDEEPFPTKKAASTEKALNELNESNGFGAAAGSEDPIDTYMRQQESPAPMQAPNKPILPTPAPPGPAAPNPPPMARVQQTVSPREKWDAHSRLKYTGQKEGDTWYVISSAWYNRWKGVCSPTKYRADDSDLGPVDNSDIVDEHGNLFPALAEGEKYEVICKEAWDQFVDWYGQPNHALPRKIISEGEGKAKRVEVYPLRLYVYRMSKLNPASANGATPQIVVSKAAKVEELLEQVTQISTLERNDLRFWFVMATAFDERPLEGTFYPSDRISLDLAQPFPSQEYKDKRLDEALIEMDDGIVYEYCSQGVWTVDMGSLNITKNTTRAAKADPVKPVFAPGSAEWNAKYGPNAAHSAIKPVSMSIGPVAATHSTAVTTYQGTSSTAFTFNGRSSSAFTGPARAPGTVGLNNLGNTCFMSSALQCLAHCPELTEYFLTGVYRDELNPTNPLGMKGAIAEVFGALLDKLWHPVSYACAPREFKQQIQRFAPQFSGYAQHDTQEFLAFLLDGLHEDLNRVLKKPYVENPDWNGGGLKDLVQHATTSWEGYKKRNDSVIVDLFQGQYKSTLICPECEKVSITFDPFMYLTLPLPVQRTWEHVIHWVPYDIVKPHQKIPVQLSRDASVKDLKLLLKKWMGTPIENQMAVEVFSHKIYKDFEDHSPVAEITDRDMIVFYELPCSSRQTQNGSIEDSCFAVPVYHSSSSSTNSYGFHSFDLFGIPFFVVIPAEEASSEEAIYTRLVERYSPWTQQPQELYKRRVVIPHSSAASSGTSLSDDAQGAELEEKDVSEMNADADTDLNMLPVSRDPSVVEEETITNLGPQENLFTVKAYAPSRAGGYSYSAGLLNDPLRGVGETLAERAAPKKKSGWKWSRPSTPELTASGAKRPLINSEDTLLCEWDPNMLDFFFNITQRGFKKNENSLWEQWETYEHPEFVASKQARKASKDRGITLEDCLDEFTKEEMLGEDDLWYCPRCKKHQQATKKFELWKVPDILVVHLKRFSNSRLLRDKIDSFVDFPTEGLDLTNRVEERLVAKKWVEEGNPLEELGIANNNSEEPLVYDLFAVDEHLGGLGGGHYRAYADNFEDKTWYHFDDTHVTVSKARESVNSNAYVLFYRRRTSDPLGGTTHEKVVAYNEKIKTEVSPDEQSSGVEADGGLGASSVKLEQEYTSSFAVRSMFPDHSPPEHNDYYAFGDNGPILPELELDTLNPFGSNSPPNFADTLNDTLLESSHDPAYSLGYGKPYRKHSASSSNEAVSPASSFGEEKQDLWDDDMENIPDLEEADTYPRQYPNHINDEELDSDNLDHDPTLHTVAAPDPSVSPSLSPTRESAPSPPSGHEEPVPQVNVDKSNPVP